jgi:hypothetical protein
VIFGAITLLASLLYRTPVPTSSGVTVVSNGPLGFWSWFAGGSYLRDPSAVSLFWLVSLVVGYSATIVLYRLRASRLGVATSIWPYALTGVGLFGFWIAFAALARQFPGDLFIRGLTPLIPLALGLFVLSWVERSRALVLFAAAFFALVMVVNLYDIENLFSRIHVSVPSPQIGVIVPGAMLLVGAAGFWLAGRAGS